MADNSVIKENADYCINAEADAGSAITPGHALSMDANGDYVPHATADGKSTYLFADLQIDPDDYKTDAYDVGERVRAQHVRPGVKVEVIVGASQDLASGDFLVSDGDGTFVEQTDEAEGAIWGYVAEGEATTTGTGETARVEMWVV